MSESQFRDLVRRMRLAQKKYFRSRNSGWLRLSKDLEKQVDDELRHDERIRLEVYSNNN